MLIHTTYQWRFYGPIAVLGGKAIKLILLPHNMPFAAIAIIIFIMTAVLVLLLAAVNTGGEITPPITLSTKRVTYLLTYA